jgi:hypothetical protein
MKHNEVLSALRSRQGIADHEVIEVLAAMMFNIPASDPVCVIVDRAIAELEDLQESMAAVAELQADEMDNRRRAYQERGEYDSQTVRERFLWSAV